jgi:bifunctional non-homologous end joining protein LigD
MSPILVPRVVEGEEFLHQVKWDGIRGLSYIENGAIRLYTKKGRERTPFYPELSVLPGLLKGQQAVLDGEVIILNAEQKPSFQLSLIRERVRDPQKAGYYQRKYPAQYIVFDLLALNGRLLTDRPLSERLAYLREHLSSSPNIAITDDFDNGQELFDLMREKGWEGIVSKRRSSPYRPYKDHRDWFKTKLKRKILAVVAGATLKDGFPNALILAVHREGELVYIGRASVGLTQEHLRLIKETLPVLKAQPKGFEISDLSRREQQQIIWFSPRLTVWVGFLEWTLDGGLRHPKILGFSTLDPLKADGTEYLE